MELKTNVHGKQLVLRIKFFKETGMLAIKNNFEYMNWLEEQYIKQLALHDVSGSSNPLHKPNPKIPRSQTQPPKPMFPKNRKT